MAALSLQRKVLILAVIIALLAGAYILGFFFSPARVGKREAQSPLLDRIDWDSVAEVRLKSEQGEVELVYTGASWVLPGGTVELPASQSRIEALVDFLKELKRSRIVTANPEAWEDFDLGSEAARRIELFDSAGAGLVDLIIGKAETGGSSNYVRLGTSNEVVLSNRLFNYYLNVDPKFWSYLRIFPKDLQGQDLMRISVKSKVLFEDGAQSDLDYTLLLSIGEQSAWQSAEQPELNLDNSEIDLLASNIAGIEGIEFAVGVSAAEAGIDDPAAQVLISTADDRDFRLLVGGYGGEKQLYAALEGGKLIYKVSEWRLKGILKPLDELIETSDQ